MKNGMRQTVPWLVVGLLISAEAQAQQAIKTPVKDSIRYKELPQAVVIGYGMNRHVDWTICTTIIRPVSLQLKDDSTNSLTTPGMLPEKQLTVYPNPVRRGMAATLSWDDAGAGEYEVGLFSVAGALVERRVIEVSGNGQVSLLEIPASLTQGVYFLRIERAGGVRVLSRKLVVL